MYHTIYWTELVNIILLLQVFFSNLVFMWPLLSFTVPQKERRPDRPEDDGTCLKTLDMWHLTYVSLIVYTEMIFGLWKHVSLFSDFIWTNKLRKRESELAWYDHPNSVTLVLSVPWHTVCLTRLLMSSWDDRNVTNV